ncbi:aryl hydrocarbon receptor 2 [Anguilla rostrata]|uniref:aryl hydrocarbon receptor 2 n=1 Tax=Anguilla rostrata TaxID=7938 RepID=UPI0030D55C7E
MLGPVGVYAAKKRKKPVQKIPKPPPSDGAKSNPSKRHRDRLNGELDKLTSLLPFSEDVRARLDKLSVLRLSVGYLKVKSFFNATMQKGSTGWLGDRSLVFGGNGHSVASIDGVTFSEGDLLLHALNGFVLVITADGYVFYSSPTIQDYLGFHQSDVVHQSVFELIHTDDRDTFRRQLHFALNPNRASPDQGGDNCLTSIQCNSELTTNTVTYDPQHIPPENSSFLERSFVCRFRCLLDNSSGFLALNFQGRLKYLHGQNKLSEDGTVGHPQLALFAIATPVQPPSIMEIRTKTLIFQTKHKLDFTPLGIDTRGMVVLGYTEIELCLRGSGYQFIHAADMMHCADNHIRMIKTGESGFTVFRLLTKMGTWVWVQANARLVYKGGRPDFIIARQRPLTNEEGEDHLRQRRMQLPFNLATGEGVLYETGPNLDFSVMPGNSKAPKIRKMLDQKPLDPDSLLGSLLKQDQSVYIQPPDSDPQFSLEKVFMDSHPLFNVPSDSWKQGIAKPNGTVKEESPMQAMMDTLEQIIGNRNFCSSLEELEPAELQEWENALLSMNTNTNDITAGFDDILTNDIFSYVEEALFRENGVTTSAGRPEQLAVMETAAARDFPANPLVDPSTLVGVPNALSEVELPATTIPGNQGFNQQNSILGDQVVGDPQANFLGVGGQGLLGTGSEVRGAQKLTHMGPPIQTQMQPILQQTQSNDVFTQPLMLNELCAQNGLLNFDLTSAGSCAQTTSQSGQGPPVSQTNHNPSKVNVLGLCPKKQVLSPLNTTRQVHPNPMTLPLQNQMHLGMSVQPVACQQKNSINQSDQAATSQEGQWAPSIPSVDFADNLPEACAPNVQPGLLNPSLSTCLQGQFTLQTQNSQRVPSWQQQQQPPLPSETPNGHQRLPGGLSQSQGFQRSLPVGFLHQNPQNFRVGYATQKTPVPPQTVVRSCMFESGNPPANGMRFADVGALVGSPCPTQVQPYNQSPPQATCYFQRNGSEPVVGSSVIAQGDATISPQTRPIPHAFAPDGLLAPTNYLSCSEQTQIPGQPPEENGHFSFPPLNNGTTYFSENNQTNCCDF